MAIARLHLGFVLFAALSGAATANVFNQALPPSGASRSEPAQAVVQAMTVGERAAAVDPATARGVRRELELRGYLPRTATDISPIVLQAAILAFEYDQGLPLRAEPSDGLLQALILGDGGTSARDHVPQTRAAREVVDKALSSLGALGYVRAAGQATPADLAAAIRGFERAERMVETGRVSAPLMIALSRSLSRKGRVASPAGAR
jgi:hypothetical protein